MVNELSQAGWGTVVSMSFCSLHGLALGIIVEVALSAGHSFPEALAFMPSTLADSTHVHSKVMCLRKCELTQVLVYMYKVVCVCGGVSFSHLLHTTSS